MTDSSIPPPTNPRLRNRSGAPISEVASPETASPGARVAEPDRFWQMPALDSENRLVGGVASGVGKEIGIDALWVRIAFLILFAIGGWGALLYALAWGGLSLADYRGHGPTSPPMAKGTNRQSRFLGFALCVGGLASAFSSFSGVRGELVWSAAVVGVGMLVVWRQASRRSTTRSVGRKGYLMLLLGFGITAVGASLLSHSLQGGTSSIGPIAVIVVALLLVVGASPWWWRMLSELDSERQARVRSEERAVVAAHLHDSVLQTLSLIQKSAGDPQRMANLARRQERELRNWLDPNRVSRDGESVRGRLDHMATDIEELYQTPVEIVAVGDCLVDDEIEEALSAAREAVVNAAKHSEAEQVDLFVEVTDSQLEIFVRDTGKGFEVEMIASDRRGVRESIQARMERVGGSATIDSSPGEGTEVEIQLPREPEPQPVATKEA